MTFQASYKGIGEMLNSPGMVAHMRSRAEQGLTFAVADAPVGLPAEGDDHPGRYKDSFRVDAGTRGGYHNDRAYGRLINDDPAAVAIEFGHHARKRNGEPGQYVDGHHTLTRALEVMGQ